MTAAATQTKSRSSSTSSRNDLFSTSWKPDIAPPKPLRDQSDGGPGRRASLRPAGVLAYSPSPDQLPSPPIIPGSPRTSSFFDTSTLPISPPPAQRPSSGSRPATSTTTLSRSGSLRSRLSPPLSLEPVSSEARDAPFSPLYQSPSLPSPASDSFNPWQPPVPPSSDDISLRFEPSSAYLLGEGRYARVYLASYKRQRSIGGRGMLANNGAHARSEVERSFGGNWRLCAAKRMASDRESQTMGLREAFFLARLRGSTANGTSRELTARSIRDGSVYIVKLIAVKEEREQARRGSLHGRTTSAFPSTKALTRERSSTSVNRCAIRSDTALSLASSPSLPSLAQAVGATPPPPSFSRWLLLLEHAPLGTVDRLLRTTSHLVGRELWERWALEGSKALEWVHAKGVVHADIKPGNLLLTSDLHVRLSDFGSSLLIHSSHPLTDGLGLGTLPFSPPELVDPSRSFSFPVDVFALGATLYQCITGREPYRGMRSVEMMHHVRKGGLWEWEERERLTRVGDDGTQSKAGSPYPSAWRAPPRIDEIRRAGSLRLPHGDSRPRLNRMSSAESLRASADVIGGPDLPQGCKLWANWMKTGHSQREDAVSMLLKEADDADPCPASFEASAESTASSRQSSLSSPSSPIRDCDIRRSAVIIMAYKDGSPAMTFLNGEERVDEDVREVLRAMVDPLADERPTAADVRRWWESLGLEEVYSPD